MIKDVIIAGLLILCIVQLGLTGDFLKARFGLLQNSKSEYVKYEYMCGDFTREANKILSDSDIKSYMAISEISDLDEGFHGYVLIAFNPENNRFYKPDEVSKLVDVCDIDEVEPVCLVGTLNSELNYWYR